jgi:hypothetical protein
VACRRRPATRPWDIALLAADPDRAASIDFAPAYCEIRATCMVPDASPLATCDGANQDGVRVSVKGGGAYDLRLSRHWTRATLVRAPTLEASYRGGEHNRGRSSSSSGRCRRRRSGRRACGRRPGGSGRGRGSRPPLLGRPSSSLSLRSWTRASHGRPRAPSRRCRHGVARGGRGPAGPGGPRQGRDGRRRAERRRGRAG